MSHGDRFNWEKLNYNLLNTDREYIRRYQDKIYFSKYVQTHLKSITDDFLWEFRHKILWKNLPLDELDSVSSQTKLNIYLNLRRK